MFYMQLGSLCLLGLFAAVQDSSALSPLQFKRQIKCVLGEKKQAKIESYGCICRKPDKGKNTEPVDRLDKCCKVRQNCITRKNCEIKRKSKYKLKFMCDEKKARKKIDCSRNKEGSCAYVRCSCDKTAALCLKDKFKHFNKRFYNLTPPKLEKFCIKTAPVLPTTPSTKKPKPTRPPKTTEKPKPTRPPKTTETTEKPKRTRPPKTTETTEKPKRTRPPKTTETTEKPKRTRPPKTTETTATTEETTTTPPPAAMTLPPRPAKGPEPKEGEFCGDVSEEFARNYIIKIILKEFVGRREYPTKALYGEGGSVNSSIDELVQITVSNLPEFYPWYLSFEVKGIKALEIILLRFNGLPVDLKRFDNPYVHEVADQTVFTQITMPLPKKFKDQIVAIQILFSGDAVLRNLFVGICFKPFNPIDSYEFIDDSTTRYAYNYP